MLPQIVLNKINRIIDKESAAYRKTLNANVHIADISYEALKFSDPKLTVEEYTTIIDSLKTSLSYNKSLSYIMGRFKAKDNTLPPGFVVVVEDIKYGIFIVASSYSSLQTKVSKVFKSLESKFTDLSTFLGPPYKQK